MAKDDLKSKMKQTAVAAVLVVSPYSSDDNQLVSKIKTPKVPSVPLVTGDTDNRMEDQDHTSSYGVQGKDGKPPKRPKILDNLNLLGEDVEKNKIIISYAEKLQAEIDRRHRSPYRR